MDKISWRHNERFYDMLDHEMIRKPKNNKYNDCIDYVQAAINIWNHDTDPITFGKRYQYVPEKYRIIVAMYLMGKKNIKFE